MLKNSKYYAYAISAYAGLIFTIVMQQHEEVIYLEANKT
jgi:hypothetical protein